MIEKIVFLIGLCILFYISWYKVLNDDLKKSYHVSAILLFLLGFFIVIYVRVVVYNDYIFASSDESNYINMFYRSPNMAFEDMYVSGPGFILILQIFQSITGLSTLYVVGVFGLVIGALYLPTMFLLINIIMKNVKYSFISAIALVLTNYFLWPSFESRPQQLGMILLLMGGIFLWNGFVNNDKKYKTLFFFVCFSLFFIHIISFVLILLLVLILLAYKYLKDDIPFRNFYVPSFIISLLFFTVAIAGNIYSTTLGGLEYHLRHSSLGFLTFMGASPLFIFYLAFLFLILFIFVATYYLKSRSVAIINKFNIYLKHVSKKWSWAIINLFILSIISGIILQFYLGSVVYSSYYRDSLILFIIMQISTMSFLIIFIRGSVRLLNNNTVYFEFFILTSAMFLIFGVTVLLFSSTLIGGVPTNWMLRIANYFVIFASPIVAYEIINIFTGLSKDQKIGMKKYATHFIILGIVALSCLSTVSLSKDPDIYNYEMYWTDEDIACISWATDFEDTTMNITNVKSDFTILSKERAYVTIIPYYINSSNNNTIFRNDNVNVDLDNVNIIYRSDYIVLYTERE